MPPMHSKTLKTAIVLGMAASCVMAQSVQMDGRRLDNSLQQGSGGINSPTSQPDFRLRNNMITGNVPGLGYFHGNIGYRSSGEFQGRTSSDSLFRFQAQSLSPVGANPLGYGIPQLHSAPNLNMQSSPVASLYRSISPTSVADLMSGNTMSTQSLSSGLTVRVPSNTYTGMGIDTMRFAAADRLNLSFRSYQDGRLQDMTASPLLGIRRLEISDVGRFLDVSTNPARLAPAAVPGGTDLPTVPGASRINALQPGGRIEPSTTGLATHEVLRDRSAWSPALALGLTMSARLQATRVDEQVNLDEQVQRLQAQLLSPMGSMQMEPGRDVYMDILGRIRDNVQRVAGKTPDTGSAPTQPGSYPVPGGNQSSPDGLRDLTGNAPRVEDPMARYDLALQQQALRGPMTAEQLQMARQQRDAAMARARGLTIPVPPSPDAPESTGTHQFPTIPGDFPSNEPQVLPESLQALIESLRRPGPALTSLAADRSDLLNNLLRLAEGDLANGRYFDSESRYRAVLDLDEAHPMARIGQIHAQMAAGMVYSATLNLRRWMEDHPELMAVRYQPGLLPPADRLEFIRNQLDEMIRTGQRTEPPLLLAYLGYQFSLPEVTRYALDVAQARSPMDPLLPLLRRLWLATPGTQP